MMLWEISGGILSWLCFFSVRFCFFLFFFWIEKSSNLTGSHTRLGTSGFCERSCLVTVENLSRRDSHPQRYSLHGQFHPSKTIHHGFPGSDNVIALLTSAVDKMTFRLGWGSFVCCCAPWASPKAMSKLAHPPTGSTCVVSYIVEFVFRQLQWSSVSFCWLKYMNILEDGICGAVK